MTALGAEALDLVRRRVINVVGHELRTPMTTVRGLAEIMVTASDEELRTTLLPALLRNARRAERLLDDLLIAGEISTARPTDRPVEIDLAEVVADAVDGTSVQVDGSPESPVLGHRDGVVHAIGHLIDNAERYGGGDARVAFEADPDTVTVVVSTPVDHEVEDLELGFELFFRGEVAVTTSAGLGVGLPIARALARLDDGDVTIDQTGGCVVTRLSLPRASA